MLRRHLHPSIPARLDSFFGLRLGLGPRHSVRLRSHPALHHPRATQQLHLDISVKPITPTEVQTALAALMPVNNDIRILGKGTARMPAP